MASKQQEVEVLESWEEIEETDVLDQKFKSIIPPSKSLEPKSNGLSSVPIKILLTGDDALRTQYVPPEPTVKILKRPSKEPQNTNDSKVFQPKKTLQQRKQEYAEARLRILGETEKTEEEKISIVACKARSSDLDNVIRLPKGPDGSKGFNIRR
ncbi:SUZ domain-containing protein 1 [Tribolium castaneum]|uniref:SUZ RNA-binding domain-containing n=1 Tax=Tribolium castaneum TaxID=7070 RepID=D6WWB9_TRICA|nr:PREDICTED: SUZ domain-containing protein 1 [Tribolium castaneum]EFA09311.2 SUZ domain-containing protein 1-like Protein [Tribolium castaneum]|eukprot:XP_008196773.1 PREDICTED: SUZ domain-containing protein 1 [Tribolium castaneum]